MAVLLPLQVFSLAPDVGKSFYENLNGGADAAVTVNNLSEFDVALVITSVNAPVQTYVIPGNNSLTLVVPRLLVAALLTGAVPAFGTIQVVSAQL
ncbi:hypothetical protein ABDI30_24315 [Paenibacillus cisolokensis]|uniref:hypothetical protein n=1 Tax=Paenibacillus cisolokensis TaxID=1658519 RepID=UPI003D2DECC5